MTREEAINVVRRAALVRPELIDALTTLAPAVRYEPPTQEEVGDGDKCWVWKHGGRAWERHDGKLVRAWWNGPLGTLRPHFTAWLPYSAIPEGGA